MNKIIYLCFIIFFSITNAIAEQRVKPFTSDACSSFPNGTKAHPQMWAHCCVMHDYDYWKGDGGFSERELADKKLSQCVDRSLIDHGSDKRLGKWMYYGTRIGGTGMFKSKFRWGYGWDYNKHERYNRVNSQNLSNLLLEIENVINVYNNENTIGGLKVDKRYVDEVINYIKKDFKNYKLRKISQ